MRASKSKHRSKYNPEEFEEPVYIPDPEYYNILCMTGEELIDAGYIILKKIGKVDGHEVGEDILSLANKIKECHYDRIR